tara:strand:- start:181 stop:465 length:285 start_codon:yes stop_codon:yes gene_type:complete
MPHSEKISLKINVEKIDKQHLYQGEKGKYLTLTIVPTPTNEWNDYMVTQYLGKGVDDIILGNGRDLVFKDSNGGDNGSKGPAMPTSVNPDDLPF